MKTQTMPTRVFRVELKPEEKVLTLLISIDATEKEPAKQFFQTWNLEVVPFDDAMSQCISIIYPQRTNVNPQRMSR